MQVDFLIVKDSDGNHKICELVTGNVINLRAGEFFSFGFVTEVIGSMFEFGDVSNKMIMFFVKKI